MNTDQNKSISHKMKVRLLYFLEGLWLPIHAQFVGLHHLIRGHNTKWFEDPDIWNAHLGWIYCHSCPDCGEKDNDVVIWGFYFWNVHKLTQAVCGLIGHREAKEAEIYSGKDDEEGNSIYEPSGQWYCSRCLADVPTPD